MSSFCRIVFLLILIVLSVKSAKILIITPVASISHHYVFRGFVNELARSGHELVVVTPDTQKSELLHENVEEVDIRKYSYGWKKKTDFPILLSKRAHPIDSYKIVLMERDYKQKNFKLSSPRLAEILENDGEKFDVIFHEPYYNNLMYYTEHFEAATIGIATALFPTENYLLLEMPYNPMFYTQLYGTHYDVTNGVGDIGFSEKIMVLYTLLKQMQLYEEYLKKSSEFNKKISDIELHDLIRNKVVNFLFMSHFDNGNRPVTEKIKFLGDMFTGKKSFYEDDIAEDLITKMNTANNGIIYFSLGTNVNSTAIANRVKDLFKSVFRELDQFLIFWKWDSDVMEDKPDNVLISKNFPQYKILKHPNTKLLITHGGRQSLDEALAAEIPVVMLPIWVDQPSNAHYARKSGLGHVLDVFSVTKEVLKETILEVINNPIYKQNTIRHKKRINDVPKTGLETASYWIDYVLRHKTTKHFDPEPSDFITFFWIDVVAFLIMTVLCISALIYVSCKYVLKIN